jgi:hypothetical protein
MSGALNGTSKVGSQEPFIFKFKMRADGHAMRWETTMVKTNSSTNDDEGDGTDKEGR